MELMWMLKTSVVVRRFTWSSTAMPTRHQKARRSFFGN